MGCFAVGRCSFWLGTVLGLSVFAADIALFVSSRFARGKWWPILLASAFAVPYLIAIVLVLREPVGQLKEQTKEEEEDHEYTRLVIDYNYAESVVANEEALSSRPDEAGEILEED